MTTTHYIAETDGTNTISAIWFKPEDCKSPRPFDATKDRFSPNDPAVFSGASEAEITQWLLSRAKFITA